MAGPELWLARPGRPPVRFGFHDDLRPDAVEVVAGLRRRGLAVELLSGDRLPTVAAVADTLGITRSEEHTSELQSLMRISYAVLRLTKQNHNTKTPLIHLQ